MNTDDSSRSLIRHPDYSIAAITPGPHRILAEMASQTLTLARRVPLFKIGEYEWCEPDYRQILVWAEQMALDPEEVIRRLLDESVPWSTGLWSPGDGPWWSADDEYPCDVTAFRDGKLVNLHWNLELLPVKAFQWVSGLDIESLNIVTPEPKVNHLNYLHLDLPKLRKLQCEAIGIQELDLSGVPCLQFLTCAGNQLVKLDLSLVPELKELNCHRNHLADINLSGTPALRFLDCSKNKLRKLVLYDKGELEKLICNDNLLQRLWLDETPLSCVDPSCDSWVYVQDARPMGNGALGFFPGWLFEQLRLDETQPEAAYSDYEAYLTAYGYTMRARNADT